MKNFPSKLQIGRLAGSWALSGIMVIAYSPFPTLAQTPPPTPPPTPKEQPLQPTSSIPIDPTYVLGAGDRIRVDIFNVPEYSGEFLVLSDGTVNLPLAGSIPLRGLTLQQASQRLETQMVKFIKNPIITLSLTSIRPLKVAIAGEVNRPGAYTIAIGSGGKDAGIPTVTRLIELAGGITQAADLRNIQVRRPTLTASTTQPNETLTVNLWELLQKADLSQDLLLRDGDSIYIPTNTAVNLAETSQMASASFASDQSRPVNIAIVGEVNRPGTYTLTSNQTTSIATVTRALQTAGGITPSADIRQIQVRRPTKTGSDQIITVNLWKLLQEGELRQDLALQEGDTIVVAEATELTPDEATELASTSFSPDKITVNVVGEAIRPGVLQVPPNTPLAQGLLAAGGFNNSAKKSSVELIRLNSNGTISRRKISVDFSRPLNEDNNPALRNNDTIVVGRSWVARFSDSVAPIFGVLGTVGGLLSIPGTVGSFGQNLLRILNF